MSAAIESTSTDLVLACLQRASGRLVSADGRGLNQSLQEATGLHPRTINHVLGRLEAAGQIRRVVRGKRTFAIELLDEAGEALPRADSLDPAEPVTRARIIDAAISLFAEKGFHGCSMREIGTAAGVSGAAVYHHFATKQDILAAAFFELGDRFFAGIEAALQHEASPAEGLDVLLNAYADAVLSNVELMSLVSSDLRHLSPSDRAKSERRRNAIGDSLTVLVARARPDLSAEQARVVALASTMALQAGAFLREYLPPDDAVCKAMLVEAARASILGAEPVPAGRKPTAKKR